MNTFIQNLLVFSALGLALFFLIRKFAWSSTKKQDKACGNDDCGCH